MHQNPSHVQHVGENKPMLLRNYSLKEYEYTQIDGQVRYLLAPDSEHAAWSAAELSGGSQFVVNVKRTDEW
jgi:hypothetical protein